MHASKLLVVACLAVGPAALAQNLTYEVVAIKPAQPVTTTDHARLASGIRASADGLSATNTSIRSLIASAYNIKTEDVSGVPDSLSSSYDINAKIDEATAAALDNFPPDQRVEQLPLNDQTDTTGPSLFTALEEHLGLKLEPTKISR